MNVGQAIRAATERLALTSETARLDAELLMAHCHGVSRSDLLIRCMDQAAPATFASLVERRAAHEPVAYIVGEQEFFGRPFAVGPGVLIPRPDSETLIEAALDLKRGAQRVLDLGTGSGALLLTFIKETGAMGVGLDRSPLALRIARDNAEQLGLMDRVSFLERDWTQSGWADGIGQFDLVLLNPPYVETGAQLEHDVLDYEPPEALFAGPEGLNDYRQLIPQLRLLMSNGANAILEIGATQASAVTKLAENAGFDVALRHDLANRPRALILS